MQFSRALSSFLYDAMFYRVFFFCYIMQCVFYGGSNHTLPIIQFYPESINLSYFFVSIYTFFFLVLWFVHFGHLSFPHKKRFWFLFNRCRLWFQFCQMQPFRIGLVCLIKEHCTAFHSQVAAKLPLINFFLCLFNFILLLTIAAIIMRVLTNTDQFMTFLFSFQNVFFSPKVSNLSFN